MTKLTVLWLAIVSFIAVLVMFLFRAAVFQECYGFATPLLGFAIPYLSPFTNCMFYVGTLIFLVLFLGSTALTFAVYAIYVLVYNRPMPSAQYFLWLSWLVFLYLILFEIRFFPAI